MTYETILMLEVCPVEKNKAYKSYRCFNRKTILFEKFKYLQNQLNILIENSVSKDNEVYQPVS